MSGFRKTENLYTGPALVVCPTPIKGVKSDFSGHPALNMAGFKRTGVGDKLRILTGQPMLISMSYKKSSKLLVKISRPHPPKSLLCLESLKYKHTWYNCSGLFQERRKIIKSPGGFLMTLVEKLSTLPPNCSVYKNLSGTFFECRLLSPISRAHSECPLSVFGGGGSTEEASQHCWAAGWTQCLFKGRPRFLWKAKNLQNCYSSKCHNPNLLLILLL